MSKKFPRKATWTCFYFVSPLEGTSYGCVKIIAKVQLSQHLRIRTGHETAAFPIQQGECPGVQSWKELLDTTKTQPVHQPGEFMGRMQCAEQYAPCHCRRTTALERQYKVSFPRETSVPTPAPPAWLELLYAQCSRKDTKQ